MRTKPIVHFTIDVECSVGGAYNGPDRLPKGYDLRFWGRLANQERAWGIGFIMDELERYGFAGTFFVEAFCEQYFSRRGLADACRQIIERGHDVQLHLHPGMRNLIPGAKRQVYRQSDFFCDYDLDNQTRLLREGIDILKDCGVEGVCAFRAGNCSANDDTIKAVQAVGLSVSSNHTLGAVRRTGQKHFNDAFRIAPGVLELPITSMMSAGRPRHLAMPAVSLREMTCTLRRMRSVGYRHITFLLHSFEYVHVDDRQSFFGRPLLTHIKRLKGLCAWLDAHRDQFEVMTVRQAADMPCDAAADQPPLPAGRLSDLWLRRAEQLLTNVRYRYKGDGLFDSITQRVQDRPAAASPAARS